MRNLIVFTSLFAVISLVGAGCPSPEANSPAGTSTTGEVTMLTHENAYGYSIDYPSDYQIHVWEGGDVDDGRRVELSYFDRVSRKTEANMVIDYLNDPAVYVDVPLFQWVQAGYPSDSPYQEDYPNRERITYGDYTYTCSVKSSDEWAKDNDCFIWAGDTLFKIEMEATSEEFLNEVIDILSTIKFQ